MAPNRYMYAVDWGPRIMCDMCGTCGVLRNKFKPEHLDMLIRLLEFGTVVYICGVSELAYFSEKLVKW